MSGKTKRVNIEADTTSINLGNIQIRDGRGNAILQDVDPDPTAAGIDSAYVQDPTLHSAMGPIASGSGFSFGSAVPVGAGGATLTALSGVAAIAPAKGLVVQAMVGNAGPIAVALVNTVDPTPGAQVGAILQPGQSVPMPVASTDDVFVRSTNAADRITWWGG